MHNAVTPNASSIRTALHLSRPALLDPDTLAVSLPAVEDPAADVAVAVAEVPTRPCRRSGSCPSHQVADVVR